MAEVAPAPVIAVAPGAPSPTQAPPAEPTHGIPADPGAVVAQRPAKAEAKPADRPDFLLPKFKTLEDQAKAYVDLEKKLGGKAEKPPVDLAKPDALKVEKKAEAPKAQDDATAQAEKAVTDAGLDWAALTNEFDTNGKLSDESYAALEKAKIPKALADDFIEGQKARGEMVRAAVAAELGGDAVLKDVLGWIADSATNGTLTQAELDSYNAAVSGRDKAAALAAVRAMHGRYISEVGVTPSLVRGGGVPAGDVYQSMQQVAADCKTDLYKRDPAERERVANKLARSKLK